MRNQIARAGIFGVAILAPFLGGATEHWSQSILLGWIAMLVLLAPPREGVDAPVAGTGLGLLALAGLAYLPGRWFAPPSWRQALMSGGIAIAPTRAPQPWVTLDGLLLFLAGLLWANWLFSQNWPPSERRLIARLFSLAALGLAAVALCCFYFHWQIPFWLKTERGFGPFPNRNQTADFFALSAIVTLGLACDRFKHRDQSRLGIAVSLFWLATGCTLIWALLLSYSRAGVAIFFLGLLLWVAALSKSYKKMSLGLGAILGLLTGFLLFGGATLERFLSGNAADFRFLIWKDTWGMIKSAPLGGIGLGNFEALFPFFRNASILQQRIKHPESDWLWIAAEMGIPALLVIFAGFGAVIRRAYPFRRNTGRMLRAACAAAALAFMAHGFVDVSAHRLGTVLPALLILAISLNPPEESPHRQRAEPSSSDGTPGEAPTPGSATVPVAGPQSLQSRARSYPFESLASPWIPWLFRLAALGLLGAAWVWFKNEPGEKASTRQAIAQKQYPAAVLHASAALHHSPLDWELYYLRGSAQAASGQWMNALFDFRRANLLEPHYVQLPVLEGNLWLSVKPPFALGSWEEALRRCEPEKRGELFSNLLDRSSRIPGLLRSMESLIRGNPDLELDYLPYAPPERLEQRLARLLSQSKSFSPAQRKRLLLFAARYRASQQQFESAYQLARKAIAVPILPTPDEGSNALRDFSIDPGNFSAGFALYSAQMKAGAYSEALLILEEVNQQKNAPKYFHFLAAELNAQLGNWEKAWLELSQFAL